MRTFTFILLLFHAPLFAQTAIDVHVGSLSGIYTYSGLKDFASSYNTYYANDPDLDKDLKFKTVSTGYQFGFGLSYGRFLNGSIDFGSVKTGVSRAEWGAGFDRGFQIKSFLFDLDAGIYITPSSSPLRLSVGLGACFQSTQIEAFLEYDKTRSYGGESTFNGVWSSWKGYTPLVVKGQYTTSNNKWKVYGNFKLPIQKKKTNSVGYTYSAGFTSTGNVFPADFSQAMVYENRLDEDFRFVNITLGIAYVLIYSE